MDVGDTNKNKQLSQNKDHFVSTALWVDQKSAKNSKWPPTKFKLVAGKFQSDF